MPDRVFIIHGWKAVPIEGWRPWLKTELGIGGYMTIIPEMPDPVHPDLGAWVAHLHKEVKHADEHTHFIGHSLGVPAILRYIESLPERSRVGRVVSVAGFCGDVGIEDVAAFVSEPFDFKRIRSRISEFVCIYSDNDAYVPVAHADIFCEALSARRVLIPGGKHFSSNDGYTTLPAALEAFTRKLPVPAGA